MPYTKENPPDRIKGLPKHAQEIWISAYNSAIKQYDGDEEKANATAWAAVKKKYKKNEKGDWVKMSEEEPNFDEVEIFKTGTYPQGTFNKADLDEIVENYNPRKHEAPVTIDHNSTGPAFGWVQKIWRDGSKLYAKLKQISPFLKDQIKSGAYKKRSIEIWQDFESTGKLMLKAVSFLGAMVPQIKGMGNIYTDYDDVHGFVSIFTDPIEFKATEEDKNAQKARSTKYEISIIEGGHMTKLSEWSGVPDDQWGDPVNYVYPCPSADQTLATLKYWDMPRNKGRYSSKDQEIISNRLKEFAEQFKIESKTLKHSEDDMTPEEVKELLDKQKTEFSGQFTKFKEGTDQQFKKLTDENADLKKKQETKFAEGALKAKEERIDETIKQLIADNKIIPAYVDAGLKKFLMAQPEGAKIEFGEGDDKKEIPVIDFAIDLFSNKIKGTPVHFGELSHLQNVNTGSPGYGTEFKVISPDEEITSQSFEVHEKTLIFMEEHNKQHPQQLIDYKEALFEISKQA